MNLLNFNSNNKSWKVYTNTLTSIANDDLLIKPNNTNDLILEVSANNNIILKRGDISYSINTKISTIDSSFSNVYSKFTTIDSSFIQVNTKFLLIDASFNNKLASISGSIVPLNDISYNLGSDTKAWANAYIRDISVTNISASGNIIPLFNLSGSLGTNTRQWANAYIKDISGLVNINGQPYGSGSNINLENISTNVNPSTTNSRSLGISSQKWGNAYIRDLSVGSIDVSVNLNPLNTSNSSLGSILKPWNYAYIRDLSVNSLIPYNDISSIIGSVVNPWDKAYIYDLSVTNINGQPYVSGGGSGSIDLTNVTTNINPSITNTGSLGINTQIWGNAYIRDLSVNSIDVSVNLNPSNHNNSSLGTNNKLWGNAYIRDISVVSIDVSENINPLTNNSGSLGISNKLWSSAYIYNLNVSSIDVSANLTPLITSSSNLGTSFKPWGNAYIRDLNVTSINVITNISPVTTNTCNLGTYDRIWGSSFIKQLVLQHQSTASVPQDANGIALVVYNPSTAVNNKSIVQIRGENGTSNRVALSLDISNYGWQISIRQGSDTNRTLYFNSLANGLNATTHLTIDGAGTNRLTYQGSVYASTTLLTSDDRLKHNEVIINNGLTIIDQLTPKFYQKTLEMLDTHYYGDLSGYTWSFEAGLIAQEVLQINDISYLVFDGDYYDENNNFIKRQYGINYNSVFTYGLAATKELHTKVKIQESSILSLQTNILSQETTILNQQTIINSLIATIEALEKYLIL